MKQLKDLSLNDINILSDSLTQSLVEVANEYKDVYMYIKVEVNHEIYSRSEAIVWECLLHGVLFDAYITLACLIVKDNKLILIPTSANKTTDVHLIAPNSITYYADIIYDMNKSIENKLYEYLSK